MDDARFTRLYETHAERVLRYSLFRTGRLADAEDVAAETFARLLAKGDAVADERAGAWLLTVANRLCVDGWRRRRHEEPLGAAAERGAWPEYDGWSDQAVPVALHRLTRRQQHVVYLRAIEDLPFAEIASTCGRSEPAVRMTYHRALKSLARALEGARDDAEG